MRATVMQHRLPLAGSLLVLGVAAALLGCGGALAALHIVNVSELVGVFVLGSVLIAAAVPRRSTSAPRNNFAQGSSRPASPTEIQAAAQGKLAQQQAHQQKFTD